MGRVADRAKRNGQRPDPQERSLWEEIWRVKQEVRRARQRLGELLETFGPTLASGERSAARPGSGPKAQIRLRQAREALARAERWLADAWEKMLIFRYGSVCRRVLLFLLEELGSLPEGEGKELAEERIREVGSAHPRTIGRVLRRLEEDGWIEREARGGRPGCCNRYRLRRRLPPDAHEQLRQALLRFP